MCGSKQYNNGTDVINLTSLNISKYFSCVYVLVKKNDIPIPTKFYMKELDSTTRELMKNNLVVWKTSIRILKNKKHFDRMSIISKENLEIFNDFNFELNSLNIILPILNISFKNLYSYLESLEGSNIKKLYNQVVVTKYFDDDLMNIKNNLQIENLIKTMEESDYWVMPYNCLANLTDAFKYRKFNKNFMKKLPHQNIKDDDKDKKEDYLDMIFKSSKYVDASNIIQKNGFKLFNVSECEYTKQEFNQLFNILDTKNRYYLFCNIMVSKKYCHLVVNNEYILDLMKNDLSDKPSLFRYLLGYSWLRFYFEESIKKRTLTSTDNIVFDINTASKLPVYPFSNRFPKMNPYMPIMVSDSILNAEKNICGLIEYKNVAHIESINNKGICNLDEFKKRMNLFITNNPEGNIFNDIEWSKWKVAIGGSVMAACLQREHPLVTMFNEKTQNDKLIRFFNEYYALADIDVMFLHENIFDYFNAVKEFYNQVLVNTCIIYSPYAEPEHIKLKQLFQIHYCVNEDWVKKNITNENITFDFVYKNIEDPQIQKLFEPHIEEAYNKYIANELKNFSEEEKVTFTKKYPEFFTKVSEFTFKIYIYLNKEEVLEKETYDTIKINYKFRITSPYFNHPMELFKVYGTDHMNVVSQFHLPCVRALYNGSTVFMTPSCVSAHLTYMNIDYKYFAGSNDPIEIINKYRMRGFGTWLNEQEIKDLVNYSSRVPCWSNLYGTNNNAKLINHNLGCLPMAHKLFHPRMINADDYYEAPPISLETGYNDTYKGEEIFNLNELEISLKNKFKYHKYNIDMTNFCIINPEGHINPLKKWIIDAYYNLSFEESKTNLDKTKNDYNNMIKEYDSEDEEVNSLSE